jgi:hypothetical protein
MVVEMRFAVPISHLPVYQPPIQLLLCSMKFINNCTLQADRHMIEDNHDTEQVLSSIERSALYPAKNQLFKQILIIIWLNLRYAQDVPVVDWPANWSLLNQVHDTNLWGLPSSIEDLIRGLI